jgi:glycosyltransferase involved in cell wall biosynthesis
MKRISCIIPAYNAALWIERAIQSLLKCGQNDLEILIVDDGSVDETCTIARRLANSHDSISVWQHPGGENRGVSASRNLGIRNSTGELICFLDGDDYVYSHRFETALELLLRDPSIDGVYETTEMVFANDAARAEWPENERVFGFQHPISSQQLLGKLLQGRCWATSAILFRRSLLDRTGLFDEDLAIAEDCHLWFRMATAGVLVPGNLQKPVSAYWRSGASAFQPDASRKLDMLRAMHRFLSWLKQQPAYRQRIREAHDCVMNYAINGIISLRTAGNKSLARKLAWKTLRMFPGIIWNHRFQKQFISLLIGR